MFSYKKVTTAFIVFASFTLARMVVPQQAQALAWSDWYIPSQFEGNVNDSGTWADPINVSVAGDALFMRNTTSFGNPAPQKWAKGFGFYIPEMLGRQVVEIEVRARTKRLYNVAPTTSMEVFITKTNEDLTTALNAPTTDFTETINQTTYQDELFFWRDNGTSTWVSDYIPNFNDYGFWVVLTSQLNSSTGSSNFLDISYLEIRFRYNETDASSQIPQSPTRVQLAIENFQDTVKVRAPFAYFYAVTDIDFSEITPDDFSFTIPLPFPTGTINYVATLPPSMSDVMEGIRTLTGIGMIGGLIIYLISLGNRII